MRYISFTRSISPRSIEDLITSLKNANAPESVYVDSHGGEFEFFSIFAPAIRRMGISTIAGNVRSSAVLLFLLGHQRYSLPDSTFFFHEIRALVGDPKDSNSAITICNLEYVQDYYKDQIKGQQKEIVQEWHRRMKSAQSWFIQFISETTRVPAPTFLDLMRCNATLSARDAVRYGLAQSIVAHDQLHAR